MIFGNRIIFFLAFLIASCSSSNNSSTSNELQAYITLPDKSMLFESRPDFIAEGSRADASVIEVNPSTSFQEIDGFGYSLTGGSAFHLANMSSSARSTLLNELFSPDGDGIGISFLRVSVGASDLDRLVFSYNDMPDGSTDFELSNFSIAEDQKFLIPILTEILTINPELKILGSPWSAPAWMKTNNSPIGGELRTDCYEVYADYFVRYIQAMANEGITIDAITVQNEPLHDGNNPSMNMSWQQQANFVKNNLGPAFAAANINTDIFLYDHNADRTDYPINIMNDPDAKQYVAGSAFHLYGGSINDLSSVHQAHPDKDIYFTEQWTGANGSFSGDLSWHVSNLIIGGTRNWCKVVLEWNLSSDPNLEPHTPGGCTLCLGAITIDGDEVSRNVAYYIIAHASKFVRPGSQRIESNQIDGLENVAFTTPDNRTVLIVRNQNNSIALFNILIGDKEYNARIPNNGIATLVF